MTPDPKALEALAQIARFSCELSGPDWAAIMEADFTGEYVRFEGVERILRSLASQPAEPEARYSAIRDAALEDAAKVADEMTTKWGNPIGSDYEQGVNDQGIRIAGSIRTRILKAPPAEPEGGQRIVAGLQEAFAMAKAEPEGFETTAEERAQWLRMGSDGIFQDEDLTRCARDLDRVLRENAALRARAEKAEAELAALKQPAESAAVDHSIATLMRYAVKMELFVGETVPNELRSAAMLLGKVDQERARLLRDLELLKQSVGDAEVEALAKQLDADAIASSQVLKLMADDKSLRNGSPIGSYSYPTPPETSSGRAAALLRRLSRENEEKGRALRQIAEGREVRHSDGSTEMVDDGDAADIARSALSAGKEGA